MHLSTRLLGLTVPVTQASFVSLFVFLPQLLVGELFYNGQSIELSQGLPCDEDDDLFVDGQIREAHCASSITGSEVGEGAEVARPYSLVQMQTHRGRLLPLQDAENRASPENYDGAQMAGVGHSSKKKAVSAAVRPAMGSSFVTLNTTVQKGPGPNNILHAVGSGSLGNIGIGGFSRAAFLLTGLHHQIASFISSSVQRFRMRSTEAATLGILILVMILIVSILLMLFVGHTLSDPLDQGNYKTADRDVAFTRNIAAPGPRSTVGSGVSVLSVQHSGRGTLGQADSNHAPSPLMMFVSPSLQAPLSSQSVATSSGRSLCPELVVPDGNECVLAMPLYQGGRESGDLMIADKHGSPLLRVSSESTSTPSASAPFASASKSVGSQPSFARLVLLSAENGNRLAHCDIRLPGGSGDGRDPRCTIFTSTGDIHASLWEPLGGDRAGASIAGGSPSMRSYIIGLHGDATRRLQVNGDIGRHDLKIIDTSSALVATVEPGDDFKFDKRGGQFYKLRVAPQGDAGLIIMALLAIARIPQ